MARFDWGLGAVCFGASPFTAVFGSAPGSATSQEHRIHSNPIPLQALWKQDISTLPGLGHFYFALTDSTAKRTGDSCGELRMERGPGGIGLRAVAGQAMLRQERLDRLAERAAGRVS